MPHDPHAAFDRNVLDLIDQSANGAVPGTPSYQDALGRLRATHQVYPDADHKEGYVTARMLATRPSFHASNLDTLTAGPVEAAALESNARIFDRYVASLPAALRAKAENHRVTVAGRTIHHREHGGVVASDPVHSLFLVPGGGPHPGIAGNYLYGFILQPKAGPAGEGWAVHLHDRDDGAAIFETTTAAEAVAKLQEVIASAPFYLEELDALGFRLI